MKVITIGRHHDNDVVIKDPTVGRHHLQITQHDDGSFSILDINSKNGTFVNGKRVYGEVCLKTNDVVQIGRTTLSWMNFFSSKDLQFPRKSKKKVFPITLGISCVVGVLTLLFVLFESKEYFFRYDLNNINTQVLVFFSKDIPSEDAISWLKKHNAKILDSNISFDYYLICSRNERATDEFVSNLEMSGMVDFIIRNQRVVPCDIRMTAIDDSTEPMSKTEKISHGEMVRKTMEMGSVFSADLYNINEKGKGIKYSDISSGIMNTCEKMSDTDLNIINISLGVSDSIYNGKLKRNVKMEDEQFFYYYAEELMFYTTIASKCGKQNFIITKAMGNEGVHDIDKAFRMVLTHKDMDSIKLRALKEHIIFVAAKDTRKDLDHNYSNTIQTKIDGINTIMVDLSNLPKVQRGTSAAAPLVANWIAKSGLEKASDVIDAVNRATQKGELVSEQAFKKNVETVIQANNELITSPILYEKINDEETSHTKDAIIEGVIKMYVLNPYDDYGQEVSQYCETDYTNTYLAFVVKCDNVMNVEPYLDEGDVEFLGSDELYYSSFMLAKWHNISAKELANKYANRRVRVRGFLSVPGGGWRNATTVVMDMKEIKLMDDSKPKDTSQRSSGIPKSLIGTKWETPQQHNNWTGKKRTLEFIGFNKVRIIDEVLFYLISTSNDIPAPEIKEYDCYYDSSEDRIIIKKKSDRQIIYSWMKLQYHGGRLIETTNSSSEMEYEKVN